MLKFYKYNIENSGNKHDITLQNQKLYHIFFC